MSDESSVDFEMLIEAVKIALDDGGRVAPIGKRYVGGQVTFEDADGRQVKTMDIHQVFKKITGVREKLRVLEQKINNHKSLDHGEKAELQAYLTRASGSLTTFNYLFANDADKFQGTGS